MLPGIKKVYGVLRPDIECNVITAISIESNKCKDRAPQGELLNVMLSDKSGADLVEVNPIAIKRFTHNWLLKQIKLCNLPV